MENLTYEDNSLDISGWPTVKELEKTYFFMVLKYTKGNKKEAAKIMGISLITLYNKYKKYYKENSRDIVDTEDNEN